MKWTPSPPSLVNSFEKATKGLRGVEHRKMFGYPAVFTKGNMVAGLLRSSLVLRLGETHRARFLKIPGAKPFVAMKGRVMKQWAVVPPAMLKDAKTLRRWLGTALAYVRKLPAKPVRAKKSSRSRSAGRGRSARRR